MENQTVQLWLNKLITEKEARKRLGMSPDVPYDETYFSKYEETLALLKLSAGARPGPENKSESIANPENQYGKRGAPKLNSDNIETYLYEKRDKIKEKYKKSFISNQKLDTILNNFVYNSSIEIKNMLKKLDSDLQCSISSNMMVNNIIEVVDICEKNTIKELELVLNIKG